MNSTDFLAFIESQIEEHPELVETLKVAAHKASPETVALLDYPIILKRRWDGSNPHRQLQDLFNQQRDIYKAYLESFLPLASYFAEIEDQPADYYESPKPCWLNGWLPSLDGISLYCLIANTKPKLYMEVGSGNSTKFAHKAIVDHGLDTKIISIDPYPRAEIDKICNEIIRKPVEEVDLDVFKQLEANDILFIDNSHRVFMNSDVTTVFLEVIPQLASGVLVEIHDICLPYDYPQDWISRYYSEQYLLAAYILAKGELFDIILPNMFISHEPELINVLQPLRETAKIQHLPQHGCSFWVKMK